MTNQIQIQVLFFGACREVAQADEIVCELAYLAMVTTAWEAVKTRHPALASFERTAPKNTHNALSHCKPAMS